MRTTYVIRDGQLVEKVQEKPVKRVNLQSDWGETKSPIDGKIYDGRAAYSEHLQRNGCEIVGNDMPPSRYHGPGAYIGDL